MQLIELTDANCSEKQKIYINADRIITMCCVPNAFYGEYFFTRIELTDGVVVYVEEAPSEINRKIKFLT